MKALFGLASCLALVSTLPAQTPATKLVTAVDIGVVANDGSSTFQNLKKDTNITHKATVWAKRQKASAKTAVQLQNDLDDSSETTHRVMIREDGWAHGKDSKDAFFAHTTNDLRAHKPGTHDFVWFAAARNGAKGKVEIRWHGMTSGAARIHAAVDLNGDKKADWTGGATQGNIRKTFSVVAGTRGFAFHIQTSGVASIQGKARSSYKGFLTVAFTPDSSSQPPKFDCKTESFGTACGPVMTGAVKTVRTSFVLELVTTKIPLNSYGIHVVGAKLAAKPITLPGSKCTLIVQPTHYFFVRPGKGGTALVRVPFRPADGLAFLNQQIWLTFGGKGFVSSSTNGIKLSCKKIGS